MVVSAFLPAVMVAMLIVPFLPAIEVFLCYVVFENVVTIASSLASEVVPLHCVSLVLVAVKAVLLSSAGVLAEVWVFDLVVHSSTSQQLLHLSG